MSLQDRLLTSRDAFGSNIVGVIGISSVALGNKIVVDPDGLGTIFGGSVTLPAGTALPSPISSTRFLAGNGTAALPGYSFTNFQTSGLFISAGPVLEVSLGGVSILTITSTGLLTTTTVVASVVRAGVGAVGAPGFTFTGFLTTGLFVTAGPKLNFAVGGANMAIIDQFGNFDTAGVGTFPTVNSTTYKVAGTTGFTGTVTPVVTITVQSGIVTNVA